MAVLNTLHGRERRRQDPIGRLRRALYGLVLASAACNAAAEDGSGHHRLLPTQLLAQIGEHLETLGSVPRGLLPVSQPVSLEFPQPAETALADDRLRGLQDAMAPETSSGIGIALWMPDTGHLYVNLYCPDSAQEGERRWLLSGETATAPRRLNVSMRDERDLLRHLEEQDSGWLLAPQLILDLKTVLKLPHDAEAKVQYSRWYGRDIRYDGPQRMPQLLMSWSF